MKIELKKLNLANECLKRLTVLSLTCILVVRMSATLKMMVTVVAQTDRGNSKQDNEVIAQAEAYCKTLPDIDYGTFKIKNSLENTIDILFEDFLKAKEQKKLEKRMKTCILVGKPDAMTYSYYNFKRPLSEVSATILQMNVECIKEK
ncbi:MAG: hypothetical protein U5L95_02475 [Candidatus Saccharibacteria bacterium]|nr:hypothetical protein [Candidatus Saccharibacteria bacterium]